MKERGIGLQLILAGDGPLRTDMENLAAKLGLDDDVRFIGIEDRVHALLKTLDVFVMPSLYEGLPVTLVEAQASGVPCVISDGITEEADAGLGLVKGSALKNRPDNGPPRFYGQQRRQSLTGRALKKPSDGRDMTREKMRGCYEALQYELEKGTVTNDCIRSQYGNCVYLVMVRENVRRA